METSAWGCIPWGVCYNRGMNSKIITLVILVADLVAVLSQCARTRAVILIILVFDHFFYYDLFILNNGILIFIVTAINLFRLGPVVFFFGK